MSNSYKPQIENKKMIPSRTEFHRVNFLLQASDLMLKTLSASTVDKITPNVNVTESTECRDPTFYGKKVQKKSQKKSPKMAKIRRRELNMARILPQQMKQVLQKAVLRLDPEIKHMICRRCFLQLDPSKTCTVRLRRNKDKVLFQTTTCLACGYYSRQRVDSSCSLRSSTVLPETAT